MANTRLITRNVATFEGRTTVSLEACFWETLAELAKASGVTMADVVRYADATRDETPRASALRTIANRFLWDRSTYYQEIYESAIRGGRTLTLGRFKWDLGDGME